MKDLELMLDLLEQKRAFFLHYEREMEALPLLPAEELEACVQRGDALIKKIEELDGRLGQLLQQSGPLALSAANHSCDRGQLTPELGKLYDASMAVKAVAARILKSDAMIKERISYEKDLAMEKIKEVNQRADSVASKYQRSVQAGIGTAATGSVWQSREV